jgi:probable rRNA maturation factor
MAINFFVEDVQESPINKKLVVSWIKSCIEHYKMKTGNINYIFCSDEYLKSLNKEYLNHDYFTDILTFNNNEKSIVSGDIYISTERVLENALKYKVDFTHELLRVIIHGLLHLLGFDDKKTSEKDEMRKLEDFWIINYPQEK